MAKPSIITRKLWTPKAPGLLRIVPRENALLLRHRKIWDAIRAGDLEYAEAVRAAHFAHGFIYPGGVAIVPGSQTYNSGSGNFVVEPYNTLEVELYGGGSSGCSCQTTNPFRLASIAGGASTCTGLSLSAGGGAALVNGISTTTQNGAAGGTASGGDTNTSGNASSQIVQSAGGVVSGSVAAAPNAPGPAGGAGGTGITVGAGASQQQNGHSGTQPGGAGTSDVMSSFSIGGGWVHRWGANGASGAYCKKTYTHGVTSGYPAWAANVAYAVGAGGGDPGTGIATAPGLGAAGRVIFTWS